MSKPERCTGIQFRVNQILLLSYFAIALYLLVIQFMLTKSLTDLGVIREWEPRWLDVEANNNLNDKTEDARDSPPEERTTHLTSDPVIGLMMPDSTHPTIGL